jgi:hypothetical protein
MLMLAPRSQQNIELPPEVWELVMEFASGPNLEDVACLRLVSQRFRTSVYESTVGLILQKGEGCHGDASNHSEFSRLSDDSLRKIFDQFPYLQSLTMQHAISVTASGLGNALKRQKSPTLTSVDVSGCMNLTDHSIKSVVTGCPGLQALNLTGCGRLSDLSLKRIANGCSNIQCLRLACTNDSWDFFSDRGMRHLAGCNTLRQLDLSHNNGVTIRGIKNLSSLPNLRKLFLVGCTFIDDGCLREISTVGNFVNLHWLDVSNCYSVTELAAALVAAARPHLDVNAQGVGGDGNGQQRAEVLPNYQSAAQLAYMGE